MTNKLALILLFAFLPVMSVVMAGGINGKALFVYIFVAIMVLISWYFWHRRQDSLTPTTTERTLANIWLFIRRLVSFFGALVFAAFAVMFLFSDLGLEKKVGGSFFMLCLVLITLWVGVYGSGPRRYDWKDDVRLHKDNKKRYGWRW